MHLGATWAWRSPDLELQSFRWLPSGENKEPIDRHPSAVRLRAPFGLELTFWWIYDVWWQSHSRREPSANSPDAWFGLWFVRSSWIEGWDSFPERVGGFPADVNGLPIGLDHISMLPGTRESTIFYYKAVRLDSMPYIERSSNSWDKCT